MEREKVLEIFAQVRKRYNLQGEVMDYSRQMADAMDREDNTSVQMLVFMRRDSVQELAATRARIEELLGECSDEDKKHMRDLLNGAPGTDPLENRIAEQIASNSRLLKQIVELYRRLNKKVTHEQSVYDEN